MMLEEIAPIGPQVGAGALELKVATLQEEIRNLNFERGYIIGVDGGVRQAALGSNKDVYLRLAEMRPGEVSLHNHPACGWSPPSPDDWQMMLANPVSEMRVVSTGWTYVLKAPVGGWDKGHRVREWWTGERLRFSVRPVDMVAMIPAKIEAALPHWYSPERRRDEGSEMMHAAWSALARELGAQYWREGMAEVQTAPVPGSLLAPPA